MTSEESLQYHMRLRIYRNEICFGPGLAELMELVKEKGSLSGAVKEMNMAYSKAWKIIKRAEEDLGFLLMEGQSGGRHGGRTVLTEKGEELLDKYTGFVRESQKEVDKIFQKYF
ncbi:MAG TPA: LysR family transcriptional regulator [Lachnospiraceae bacterium]|nr:LysR family transcriptional regulator [Lachnospiraceae bacterium]